MAGISQWAQIHSGEFNGLGTSEYVLVTSQPADELDFWMKPYSPSNPWGVVHRDAMRKMDWTVEPYTHADLQLSMVEMSLKPKGKVGEREL